MPNQTPPVVYEINTVLWFAELSRKHNQPINFSNIPPEEYEKLSYLGVTAVWFMGVCERSVVSMEINKSSTVFQDQIKVILPDLNPEQDFIGSAYSIKAYEIAERFGGLAAFTKARNDLHRRNIKVFLDFVPNHVAMDHAWTIEHPEYFIHGSPEQLSKLPHDYFQAGEHIIANGKDPNFPPWSDVAQLNAFSPELRQTIIILLSALAEVCDGIRCDMAMLMSTEIFAKTWGAQAGQRPATEFWVDVIGAVRQQHKEFIFAAESYWGTEELLFSQGFDYCYDKLAYDYLQEGDMKSFRKHLHLPVDHQSKLVRFLENHDEVRAAVAFPGDFSRPAAVIMATLPGAKLYHQGQADGLKIRVPVQLGRAPLEAADEKLSLFYLRLMQAVKKTELLSGTWKLSNVKVSGLFTSNTALAWTWEVGARRYVVLTNYGKRGVYATAPLPWKYFANQDWQVVDLVSNTELPLDTYRITSKGISVNLQPWQYLFVEITSAGKI